MLWNKLTLNSQLISNVCEDLSSITAKQTFVMQHKVQFSFRYNKKYYTNWSYLFNSVLSSASSSVKNIDFRKKLKYRFNLELKFKNKLKINNYMLHICYRLHINKLVLKSYHNIKLFIYRNLILLNEHNIIINEI